MVSWFYFIVFALSLMMLIRIFITNRKVDTMLMVFALSVTINSLGRYMLATAENLEIAILSNKLIYIGACYTPLIVVLFLGRLCDLKIPVWGRNLLILYSNVVMACVLTTGSYKIYYEHVELGYGNGYNYLIKTYGPFHKLYTWMSVIYVGIMLFYMIYAIRKRRQISFRAVITMSGLCFAVFFIYIVERITGSNVSFLAIGYLIVIVLLNRYFERMNMYDMSANISNSIEKMKEYGYIAFDEEYRYVNANHYAKELFPEIENWIVDKEVPPSDSYFYQEVVRFLLAWNGEENANKYINVKDGYFQLSIRYISYGKKNRVGYLIEFANRTLEKKYYNTIEEYNVNMQKEVAEKTEELRKQQDRTKKLFVQTVTALSEAVDAKDRYTSGHSKRVAEYARMLAVKMGKSKEEQEKIYQAGLLHDVGKIRVPEEIINKPGKLTDEEFNVIKIHPVTGYHILHGISDNDYIAVAAKYHHERYDGKGYPNGLAGEKIPEVARILGVADSYDAMASDRSYRKALPQEIVRAEIEKGMGTQFDPVIAELMLQMMDEDKHYSMRQTDSGQKKILTVDDEPMNNKIIAHIMRDEPLYQITSVCSGMEALRVLEEQDFDLIMLDLKMPEMDGLETLKRIREKYRMPVVLMTSDKTLDTSVEFAKLGCDDYITKPFLPILIKEVVHNMTERTNIL